MSRHELKTWPEHFKAVVRGDKMFEVRFDDRGFTVGDLLLLREYEPRTASYTDATALVKVTYILKDFVGLKDGWVVMGFVRI